MHHNFTKAPTLYYYRDVFEIPKPHHQLSCDIPREFTQIVNEFMK